MLSTALNEHSDKYESRVYAPLMKAESGDFTCDYEGQAGHIHSSPVSVEGAIRSADLLHFHNCSPVRAADWKWRFYGKPFVIQIHSDHGQANRLHKMFPDRCITLSQKHALLRPELPAVPNIIPIHAERYSPNGSSFKGEPGCVGIVYSPSSKADPNDYAGKTCGKGYTKVKPILDKLRTRYGREKVYVRSMWGYPKHGVLEMKKEADIVIDEVVTGGFHLSGLEGLSLGCVTIGNLSPEVQMVLKRVTGSPLEALPWYQSRMSLLEGDLIKLIDRKLDDPEALVDSRAKGRAWIEKYYRPEALIKYYERVYDFMLEFGHLYKLKLDRRSVYAGG